MQADAGRLLRLGVDERHVRHVDRRLVGLDAAGLGAALRLADAHVLRDEVHALDDDAVLGDEHLDDLALLAMIAAGGAAARDDLHEVTLLVAMVR